MKVNGKDDIPYIMENKSSKPPIMFLFVFVSNENFLTRQYSILPDCVCFSLLCASLTCSQHPSIATHLPQNLIASQHRSMLNLPSQLRLLISWQGEWLGFTGSNAKPGTSSYKSHHHARRTRSHATVMPDSTTQTTNLCFDWLLLDLYLNMLFATIVVVLPRPIHYSQKNALKSCQVIKHFSTSKFSSQLRLLISWQGEWLGFTGSNAKPGTSSYKSHHHARTIMRIR